MAASAGIWHGAGTPAATNATGPATPSSGTNSATISANDFLTLLVTEMQNQDPTATTDPNEYINQLVNVNSLEQLIDINQTLSSATSGSGGATGSVAGRGSGNQPSAHAETTLPAAGRKTVESAAAGMTSVGAAQSLATRSIHGNLAVPPSKPAAVSVAHALTRP